MPKAIYDDVLRFLHHACGPKGGGDKPDRELLERYLGHEEAAFSLLMQRHGPMILGICRRLAADPHSAEDGFQATFMVLIRQAASIRNKESLAPWLHGVARRLVLKARAKAAANRRREERSLPMAGPDPLQELTVRELRSCLDEEITQLPVKYQTPILLCYFEGKSYSQAAQEIGCPKSTFTNRLNHGLELLRRQLSRRGISLVGAALATALTEAAAAPPLPAILAVNTMKAATLLGGSKAVACGCLTATALALAEEALTGMLVLKGKIVVMVLALGLAVGGVGWAGYKGMAEVDRIAQGDLSVSPEVQDKPRLDGQGDPLPEGAVARLGSTYFRHEGFGGTGRELAYTPDGKNLVGFTSSGVILWDVATGKELYRLPVGSGRISDAACVDISPDGKTLATSLSLGPDGPDPEVTLWELRSGKKIKTFFMPEDQNHSLDRFCFTADGKKIVAISFGGNAFIYDLVSGKVRVYMANTESRLPFNFAVSPNANILALAINTRNDPTNFLSIELHDLNTGKKLRTIGDFKSEAWDLGVSAIMFSPNGKILALGDLNRVCLYDTATGKRLGTLEDKMGQVMGLAFTPDGKRLIACGGYLVKASQWEVATGKLLSTIRLQALEDADIYKVSMAVAPDGKTIAFGVGSGVQFWDVATGREKPGLTKGHAYEIVNLAYGPDGKTLFSAGDHGPVFFWNTKNWQQKGVLAGNARVMSASPDGKQLATVAKLSTNVRIWNLDKSQEAPEINLPDIKQPDPTFFRWHDGGPVKAAIFSPDGRKLFTLNHTNSAPELDRYSLRHWDLSTGKQIEHWKTTEGYIWEAYLAPDGKTVFSPIQECEIIIDNAASGRSRTIGARKNGRADFLAISPDSRMLLYEDGLPGICMTEVMTGKTVFDFLRLPDEGVVGALAWSPNGRVTAGGSQRRNLIHSKGDQTIQLWDSATGKELASFTGVKANVNALAFSPDGKNLTAGLQDGTILVFDISKTTMLPPEANLSGKEMESRWTDLIDDNAAKAHQAIGTLVTSPKQSVPFLQGRLKPAALADQTKIQKWIADLDSPTFTIRQTAAKELEKVGDQVQVPIQKALQGNPSLETRRRLEQVLKSLPDIPGPETIRTIRAIMALERIVTSEARGVLEALAGGAPGARETEEARESVERLTRRGK
jgi:RNA polymerase sigma factor (sigma-70 family)